MKKKRVNSILSGILSLCLFFVCLVGCDSTGTTPTTISGQLQLEETRIELKVGETAKVAVKEEPSETTYTYRSSSKAVTVNNDGVIVAKEVGSACVTVTSSANESGVVVVIVSDTKPVQLNALTISGGESVLTVGDSRELTYEKDPVNADDYNSMRWSSSNPNVASVNKSGILTATKPGETVITLTATGTDKVAQFTLKVEARASTLAFDFDDATGVLGSNDLVLTPNLFTDYDGVIEEGYESSDPSVATVDDDGNVSFVKEGKAIISYAVVCGGERLVAKCNVAVIKKEGYTVIRTAEQLQAIGNKSGNYMLGNDIDMTKACAPGGKCYYAGQGFSPLFNSRREAFSGIFDGMGYSIKNIMINRANTPFVALFGYINVNKGTEGLIRNLSLEGGKIEGGNYVSSFVAYYNGTASENAGLENCWTNTEIVSHGKTCGGLVAYNGGMIKNCYSLSVISGVGNISSISANTAQNATIGVKDTYVCSDYQSNIKWLVNPDELNGTIMLAEYKTLEEMKNASLYSTWDTDIWLIEDGQLPVLKTANDR